MTHLLWFLAGVLTTLFVVVVWSCFVLAARAMRRRKRWKRLMKKDEVQL